MELSDLVGDPLQACLRHMIFEGSGIRFDRVRVWFHPSPLIYSWMISRGGFQNHSGFQEGTFGGLEGFVLRTESSALYLAALDVV